MAGVLRVSLAEARQIGASLAENSTAREADLRALGPKVDPKAVWEGRRAEEYVRAYDEWLSAEKKMIQAQLDLGKQVQQIIDRYDEIENGR